MAHSIDKITAVYCLELIQNQATWLLVTLAKGDKIPASQKVELARLGEIVAALQAACNVTPA